MRSYHPALGRSRVLDGRDVHAGVLSLAPRPRFRAMTPWLAELRNRAGASAAQEGGYGIFTWQQPAREWVARHRVDVASPAGSHVVWIESLQHYSSYFSGPLPQWPAEQWNALVELALAPVWSCISASLGAPVHVVRVNPAPLIDTRCCQAAAAPRLEFVFRRRGDKHGSAGALEVHPAQSYSFPAPVSRDASTWHLLPVALGVRLGSMRLPLRELRQLRAGSALRLDAPLQRGRIVATLIIGRGPPVARVVVRDDRLQVVESFSAARPRSPQMHTPIRDDLDIKPPEGAEIELPLDDLEVELTFDSGELRLSLSGLSGLRTGSVLSLGQRVADHVITVRANGQILGRGEFIELGDELAVRLTQWRVPAG